MDYDISSNPLLFLIKLGKCTPTLPRSEKASSNFNKNLISPRLFYLFFKVACSSYVHDIILQRTLSHTQTSHSPLYLNSLLLLLCSTSIFAYSLYNIIMFINI